MPFPNLNRHVFDDASFQQVSLFEDAQTSPIDDAPEAARKLLFHFQTTQVLEDPLIRLVLSTTQLDSAPTPFPNQNRRFGVGACFVHLQVDAAQLG
jgi:hypothetical protein